MIAPLFIMLLTTTTIWYRITHLTVSDVFIMYAATAVVATTIIVYLPASAEQFRAILIAYIAVQGALDKFYIKQQLSSYRTRRTDYANMQQQQLDTNISTRPNIPPANNSESLH